MKNIFKRAFFFVLAAVMMLSVFPAAAFAANDGDGDIVYHTRACIHNGHKLSSENANTAESEHFQLIWGDKNNSFVTEDFIQYNLELFEACWSLYIDDLHMQPPSLCTWADGDQTTHYKVNLVVWGTGLPETGSGPDEWAAYGGIDGEGYAYMMCSRDAMQKYSAALPHEFGHATHFAQGFNSWAGSQSLGPWYEAIGNWYREQYYDSEYDQSGEDRTDFSHLILRSAPLTATNGRSYYEAWPILQYLTENPDNLPGYGSDYVAKLLQNGSSNGFIYDMIEEFADADLDDTLGYFAAHMATFDFKRQSTYKRQITNNANWGYFYWQQFYTMLEEVPDAENRYSVPTERAPQEAAYNVVPLEINGSEIKVTLHGMTGIDGAAWKACIVTVTDEATNYSALFGDGETMTVPADGVKEAYLTVAATPRLDTYVKWSALYTPETKMSFDEKPRYPYEATIEGAVPYLPKRTSATVNGKAHENGGGLVAKTAKVDESVYVGPDAMVLGNAIVKGDARIDGHAIVSGNARVSGNAVVDGYAIVTDTARVGGYAHVGDYAVVAGSAKIQDNAQVIESAFVTDSYTVKDNATAKGLALCLQGGKLTGDGVADGDYYDDSGYQVSQGTAMGYLVAVREQGALERYEKKLRSTDGVYMSYTFSKKNEGATVNGQYGTTYATLTGGTWEAGSTETAAGLMTFAGADEYMRIDGQAVSARDLQVQLKLKNDGAGNVLSFAGTNGTFAVALDDEGKATLTLTVGDKTTTVTSNTALPKGEFGDLTITFANGMAGVTVNGDTASVESANVPADIYATYGKLGGGFSGTVDSLKFLYKDTAGVKLTATETPSESEGGDTAAPADTNANEPAATGDNSGASATEKADDGKSGCGSVMSAGALLFALAAAAYVAKKRR